MLQSPVRCKRLRLRQKFPNGPRMSESVFQTHRPRLFALAYRMLGSVADAEDVLQDAYLRWHESQADVESPAAFLRTTVTRLCIDRLRSAKVRREQYVGP